MSVKNITVVASTFGLVSLVCLTNLAGCGSSSDAGTADTGGGGEIDTRAPGEDTAVPGSDSSGTDAGSDTGTTPKDTGPTFDGGKDVPASPIISRGQPAFASSGNANDANDDNPAVAWAAKGMPPAWIAYDLSKVPVAQRQTALLAWDSIHAGGYIDTSSSGQRPLDYVIEANTAAGGTSAPPTGGWTTLVTVTDNRYCGREHVVELAGANWVRFSVTKSTSDGLSFDFDVHSAPAGAADAWLFMGDSITAMSVPYAFSDLPARVHTLSGGTHTPAVIDAAIGGTNTGTAELIIDDTMRDFPGRFVVLAYGTNDHSSDYKMESLVKHVIAAGKTPVVPHMPWSSGSTEGTAINAQIDALYVKYPQIVHGPDLWKGFEGHTEWIPTGDVHPNSVGMGELRRMWSVAMNATYGK